MSARGNSASGPMGTGHMLLKVTVNVYRTGFAKADVCEGRLTSIESRWAVVKTNAPKPTWYIVHRPSGKGVWSLYPSSVTGMRGCLAIIRAWEAHTDLDWSGLDTVTFGGVPAQTSGLTATVLAAREIAWTA